MARRPRDVRALSGGRSTATRGDFRLDRHGRRRLPLRLVAAFGTARNRRRHADAGWGPCRIDGLGCTAATAEFAVRRAPPGWLAQLPRRAVVAMDPAAIHLAVGQPAFRV